MALYVLKLPNEPAGQDWSATPPGQYTYNIVGVTARLSTTVTDNPVILPDISGNGNYMAAGWSNVATFGHPGLVAGNTCMKTGHLSGALPHWEDQIAAYNLISGDGWFDFTFDFSLSFWYQVDGIFPPEMHIFYNGLTGGYWSLLVDVFGSQNLQFSDSHGGLFANTANNSIPNDVLPHFVAFSYFAGNPHFYFDGVEIPVAFQAGALSHASAVMGVALAGGINAEPTNDCLIDEVAVFEQGENAATWTALFNAAAGGIGTYTPAVLGFGPAGYWHMDAGGPGGGRQVAFQVTNGHDVIGEYCSGFPVLANDGPFRYSWQPNLQAASENPQTDLLTVPLPKLIIPPGYIFGTFTPDIVATDQWSNIIVWWRDDYMLGQLPPYANTLLLPADWAGFPR